MPRFVISDRRCILHAFAALALCAVALWPVCRLVAWGRVSSFHDKYQKVQPDMTRQEVEAILGPPTYKLCPGGSLGPAYCTWEGRRKTIRVTFDFLPAWGYGVVSKNCSTKPATGWMNHLPAAWYQRLCDILDDFGW